MNEHNFIRAENLSVVSLEFFALLSIVFYALFKYKWSLIPTYVLFIPFTDKVYRIYDMQIADILGIIIVLRALSKAKLPFNGYIILLFSIFALGGFVGGGVHGDIFSVLYLVRISIIILTAIAIAKEIKRDPDLLLIINKAYKFIIIFSVFISILQGLLWLLGLPIDGVFWVGYIRVKGLAHEPSTFGIWLALALPLVIKPKSKKTQIELDKPLLFAILLGTAITISASAILTLCTIGTFIFLINQNINRKKKFLGVFGIIFAIIFFASAFNEIFYENIILKVGAYFMELMDPTLADTSGRGGDRYLFALLIDSPFTGIGAFRASKATDLFSDMGIDVYIPGSNFYITTVVEFGLIIGPVLIIMMFTWIIWSIRKTFKTNSQWGCAVVGWFFAISAMRIFGFHQPWLNYALFIGKK